MGNRILEKTVIAGKMVDIWREVHGPNYRPPKKEKRKNLSDMTDEELKKADTQSGMGFHGLYSPEEILEELWKRYDGMKALARNAVHGKGCGCHDCA